MCKTNDYGDCILRQYMQFSGPALREEANVILQYKLLASILSAVCSVIQQP